MTPGQRSWDEGNQLFRTGRYREAEVAFSDAIRRDPDQPKYYHNRAVARAAVQDPQGAREDLWRTLELESSPRQGRELARALGDALRAAVPEPDSFWLRPRGSDHAAAESTETDWNARLDRLRLQATPSIDILTEALRED